jgi:hypothetical protein
MTFLLGAILGILCYVCWLLVDIESVLKRIERALKDKQ